MPSHVELRDHAHFVEVRLARADKRNALAFSMLRELVAAGKSIAKRRNVRAVVLTGDGPSFCAGIDLGDLRNPKNTALAGFELLRPGANLFQQAFLVFRDLPIPVIAAIHGHCFGAGMQLALGADFRIARPDAQLSIMETRWGLVPDMAASVTLRGLVGLDVAKELAMTARVVTGTEAARIGLVTRTAEDPFAEAAKLAAELADRSPDAVLAVKRVFNAMVSESDSATLALEKKWQRRLMLGKNFGIAGKRAKAPETPYADRELD
jgi:enoyl-CoA hydratase/carnithine racemase